MPILTLGFFCLQLDRGNIANALTDNCLEDVGITQDQFNVGQQMLSLGIVLFEIPSNLVLYRVGPGKWLTLQLFLFGTVSTFQAFMSNHGSFIATRFLLALLFRNQFGQASAKVLAYGILHMRGVGGKPGWFWLFALIGGFTCLSGLVFGFFLPDSFKNPHSNFLPKVQIFTEREIHILRTRVLRDEPAKGKKRSRIGLTAFKKTFSSWRMWVHFLIHAGQQRTTTWIGRTVIAGLSMVILGYAFNRGFTELTGPSAQGAQYLGVVWTQIFGTFSHPLNITWMSLTCTDSEERALAMAMVIMGANIAGIYGAQLYTEDDSPRYRRAFLVAMAVLIFGCALAIVRKIDEIRLRRKNRDDSLEKEASQSEIDAHDSLQVQPWPVATAPPPAAVAPDVPSVLRWTERRRALGTQTRYRSWSLLSWSIDDVCL
ncbi:alternative sulfate transporter like protein [Zymoseptoria brevis]|uniref:Alternative sulfate transporter like protein n=1 Tax=Zymoseptoria brevis TaxID=1047168 RepID=A0A0F4G6J1_9PEZI|nr:alternative sulfate transporter like protein [Zymoseptoria brevis]